MSTGNRKSLGLSELTVTFRQALCFAPSWVYLLNLVVSSIMTVYNIANYPLLNILICFSVIQFLMIENKLNLYYRKKENPQTSTS